MYVCSGCGYQSVKWLGRCPFCQGWETFQKQQAAPALSSGKEKNRPCLLARVEQVDCLRRPSGIGELDRILGGGLVPGEVVLVGGEPGVGKSTLLLEAAACLGKEAKTLYVSAEESPSQIALRAQRLKVDTDHIFILNEDEIEAVAACIKNDGYRYVVIDSIQVVRSAQNEGPKGSVTQIRGCADYLTQIAKAMGVVIFIVGHVTKDGAIAGPKLLEHIVDCVLYFEGEHNSGYRILRSSKNRFGATGNIAVFEMLSDGLREVKKIDDIFLPHKDKMLSGSVIVCAIEGLRPILVEVQALAAKAAFGVVRRRSIGFDFNRFSLLAAIIEKRLKMSLSGQDVFLNVAGGLRLSDPAVDLGAVMAVASSLKDKSLPPHSVFMGEVGLAGELRRVNNINLRLKEIERAGFNRCFIPEPNLKEVDKKFDFECHGFSSLKEVVGEVF